MYYSLVNSISKYGCYSISVTTTGYLVNIICKNKHIKVYYHTYEPIDVFIDDISYVSILNKLKLNLNLFYIDMVYPCITKDIESIFNLVNFIRENKLLLIKCYYLKKIILKYTQQDMNYLFSYFEKTYNQK